MENTGVGCLAQLLVGKKQEGKTAADSNEVRAPRPELLHDGSIGPQAAATIYVTLDSRPVSRPETTAGYRGRGQKAEQVMPLALAGSCWDFTSSPSPKKLTQNRR